MRALSHIQIVILCCIRLILCDRDTLIFAPVKLLAVSPLTVVRLPVVGDICRVLCSSVFPPPLCAATASSSGGGGAAKERPQARALCFARGQPARRWHLPSGVHGHVYKRCLHWCVITPLLHTSALQVIAAHSVLGY